MGQVHKRFSDEQVAFLLQAYSQGLIMSVEVQERVWKNCVDWPCKGTRDRLKAEKRKLATGDFQPSKRWVREALLMPQAVIVVDQRDNVATALRPLDQGESVEVEVSGSTETIQALQPIPFGHKIALAGLEKGDEVRKYGEVIGSATQKIARGQHVHVHNVEGLKGRGDQA